MLPIGGLLHSVHCNRESIWCCSSTNKLCFFSLSVDLYFMKQRKSGWVFLFSLIWVGHVLDVFSALPPTRALSLLRLVCLRSFIDCKQNTETTAVEAAASTKQHQFCYEMTFCSISTGGIIKQGHTDCPCFSLLLHALLFFLSIAVTFSFAFARCLSFGRSFFMCFAIFICLTLTETAADERSVSELVFVWVVFLLPFVHFI